MLNCLIEKVFQKEVQNLAPLTPSSFQVSSEKWGSANFFCKRPSSKMFRFCGHTWFLSQRLSSAVLAAQQAETAQKQRAIYGHEAFMDTEIW